MVKKDSYNHPVKARYRELWGKFLENSFRRSGTRAKNAKVVCFPGHEGLEITEVYDQLGIPRENIVGIERDPEIADEIEASDLGIELYQGDLEDFVWRFGKEGRRFHAINLDFQGPLGHSEYSCIAGIAGFPLLERNAALGTNFLRKRELDSGELYLNSILAGKNTRDHSDEMFREFGLRRNPALDQMYRDEEKRILEKDLSEYASIGIARAISNVLIMGATNIHLSPLATRVLSFMEEEHGLEDVARKALESGSLREITTVHASNEYATALSWAIAVMQRRLVNRGWSHEEAEYIAGAIALKHANPWVAREHFSGKYISEKRSPFAFDFFDLQRSPRYGRIAFDFVPSADDCLIDVIGPRPSRRAFKELKRQTRQVSESRISYTASQYDPTERIFIGSDAKKKRKKAIETIDSVVEPSTTELETQQKQAKNTAIDPEETYDITSVPDLETALNLIGDDLPAKGRSAYVREHFSVSPEMVRSLPQYIANVTMREQRGKRKPREVAKKKVANPPNLDDGLQREKALVAAVAHTQGNEVAANYFGLTRRQVSAIKAHRTMGTHPALDGVIVGDSVYIAPSREERSLPDLLGTLGREHGGIEEVPEDILEHFGIEVY